MAINEKDVAVFTSREPFDSEADVGIQVKSIIDRAWSKIVHEGINTQDCYPELSREEKWMTLTIYRRVRKD